jgi:DNA-binding response OmpR family regulator
MLPGKDGFELCKQLRKTLDIPILMVTARKEDIDKIRGFIMAQMIISRSILTQMSLLPE